MSRLTERPTTRFPASAAATALAPPERRGSERDLVRLLVAGPENVTHARFRDLPDHLAPGDLLVVNDSATTAGQLDAVLVGRGPVVVHVAAGRLPTEPVVELRTAPTAARPVLDAAAGDRLEVGDAGLVLLGPHTGSAAHPDRGGDARTRLWRARVEGDLTGHLAAYGRPAAYGYLDRDYDQADYQTVFTRRPGSAEMPSAGRPFTPALVTRLVARGVAVAPVTLHTGLSSQEVGEAPAAEWFSVPAPTARLVSATRAVVVGSWPWAPRSPAHSRRRPTCTGGWSRPPAGPTGSSPGPTRPGSSTDW